MYQLRWTQPALDANKAAPIQVPVGTIVSNKASIRFTGKGAANYGTIQQENLMRLLEHFADSAAPPYATVGQVWYDTSNSNLKFCTSTAPLQWQAVAGVIITNIGEAAPTSAPIGQLWYNVPTSTLRFAASVSPLQWKLLGVQVTNSGDPTPSPAQLGDMWFQRTGSLTGFLYIFDGLGRYPETNGTIGGWSQAWPSIEIIAGREEYNMVYGLISQLIDITNGGSGALNRIITNLTNFTALDTDRQSKFAAAPDLNVLSPTSDQVDELILDPNSNDWDTLLAAARYAVNRLELPLNYASDISPVPFVSDGRQAPASLTTLTSADIRYPSLERRTNRRFGAVTLTRLFTETINVLSAALENRYSLKGINGASGTNASFASTVQVVPHASFSGSLDGNSTAQLGLRFNFTSSDAVSSFLNSGGAIQVTLLHVPGATGTAADTNLKTLFDAQGIIRLTADKTRIFINSLPLTISVVPIAIGLRAGGTPTASLANANYAIGMSWTGTTLNLLVDFNSTGAMNGTTTISFHVIKDTELYYTPDPVPVYDSPSAYVAGDKYGSALFT